MVKSFRFLLQFAWVNLAVLAGFAAAVIAGCYAAGVPGAPARLGGGLFENYFAMLPTMILICLFFFAASLCTSALNLGLSMGARRRDFFWAVQGIMAFYALVCWAIQMFVSALPALANWEVRDRWTLLHIYDGFLFPALCFVLLVLGCLSGMLVVRSKALGSIVTALSILVMIGATAVMLIWSDPDIKYIFFTGPWTALPQIMAGVLAVSFAGGELLVWRAVQSYVVR